jgi:hypothetical protein
MKKERPWLDQVTDWVSFPSISASFLGKVVPLLASATALVVLEALLVRGMIEAAAWDCWSLLVELLLLPQELVRPLRVERTMVVYVCLLGCCCCCCC